LQPQLKRQYKYPQNPFNKRPSGNPVIGGVRVATFISNAGKRVIVQSASWEGIPVADGCLFFNFVVSTKGLPDGYAANPLDDA
jgi:hypothetical protein